MRPPIVGGAFWLLAVPLLALAQTPADLVVSNARIIVGTGEVIDRGSLVVSDGRIVEVSRGVTAAAAEAQIDASGLTILPGLIDTHRHVLINLSTLSADSDQALERWMQAELAPALLAYLQSGITTVMSVGDFVPAIFEVRRKLESGELQGPRLLLTGPIFTAPTDIRRQRYVRTIPGAERAPALRSMIREVARQRVRELAAAGVDAIKATYERQQQPIRLGDDVLSAIGQEADRHGLPWSCMPKG